MSFYLDTNLLVSFFTVDSLSQRAEAFLIANCSGPFLVSDLTVTEFAAVVARQVRTRDRTHVEAAAVFAEFDAWRAVSGSKVSLTSEHLLLAEQYLRRLDLALMAPDAIHIAISERLDVRLVTFDQRMAAAARSLGVAVTEP